MLGLISKGNLLQLKLLSFNFYATNAIIVGFLPVYLQYKELSSSQIGIVLAAGPFASIISQPFWGYMSDKYKTVKRVIQLCLIGFLISGLIFFRMDNYSYILLFALLLFFFAIPIGALTDSLSQRMANKLKTSFGGIRVWGSIGFGLSSLLAGIVLYKIGINMMLVLLLPLILLLLFIVNYLPDAEYDDNKISLIDVKKLLLNKHLITFLFFSMFLAFTQRTNDSFIGLYVIELGGFESQIGIVWSMALLGEGIIFSLSYLWFKRLHSIQFIMFAAIFYTIRWLSYSFVTDPNILIGLQLLNGPSFAVFYLAAFSFITSLLPNKVQSTGHLLFVTMMFGVSGVISALIGGVILEKFGGSFLYLLMGSFSSLGFCLLFIYYIIFIKVKKSDNFEKR